MSFKSPPKPRPQAVAAIIPELPKQRPLTEEQVLAGAVGPESGIAERPRLRRSIVLATPHRDYHLKLQRAIIGNGGVCDILLTEPEAPRQRAGLWVADERVTIEQLSGSVPISVNGQPLRYAYTLCDGDRLLIGSQEIAVYQADLRSERPTKRRPESEPPASMPPQSEIRFTGSADDGALWRNAQKLLALGRAAEAEQLLEPRLVHLGRRARADRNLSDELFDWATGAALLLARDLRRGAWLDYAVELHLFVQRPMSDRVRRSVERAKASASGYDRLLLATYEQFEKKLLQR